jgi:hypothetical protein
MKKQFLKTKWKVRLVGTITLLLLAASALMPAAPAIKYDHLWLVVTPDAPERAALERAGFHISPGINRHDGQGTASVTVEFYNFFLELLWPDPSVPVAPGSERAAEKFRQRMLWHTSGWCPIGIGLQRTSATISALPFPTWAITPAWLPPGSAIEMLTPRDDTTSPSLFISPRDLAENESENRKAASDHSKSARIFEHPIGVERVTAIRLASPKGYRPIGALTYLQNAGVLTLDRGDEWLVELTFDNGLRGKTRDLRPDLPLLIHY